MKELSFTPSFLLLLIVATCATGARTDGQAQSANEPTCARIPDDSKRDCGYLGINKDECVEKQCCWKPTEHGGTPWCFYKEPAAQLPKYKLSKKTTTGGSLQGYLELVQEGLEHYGQSYRELSVAIAPHSPNILRMTITDIPNSRWRIPQSILPNIYPTAPSDSSVRHSVVRQAAHAGQHDASARRIPSQSNLPSSSRETHDRNNKTETTQNRLVNSGIAYAVTEEPFSLTVCRHSNNLQQGPRRPNMHGAHASNSSAQTPEDEGALCGDGETLFDMRSLVFKDKYLEISTCTPADSRLLGLGEQSRSSGMFLPRNGHKITLWNADYGAMNTGRNLYGSHPLLLHVSSSGAAHGIFIASSNALEATLNPEDTTFRMVGGVVDVFWLEGPSLEEVVQQYQQLVGRPAMPPAWSLGFHQCRWGYRTVEEMQAVVQGYAAAGIPLDTIWSDIDHMDGFRDFTLDKERYAAPKMQQFLRQLHQAGRRWVPIVDPGILVDPGYPAYDAGMHDDVFLKAADQQPYVGQVWPGAVHFPDFLNPKTQGYWQQQLRSFRKLAQWSGIWVDMNEPSNFCSGDVCKAKPTSPASTRCELVCYYLRKEGRFWNPPYHPDNVYGALGTRTVAMSALGHRHTRQWDAHNLYGMAEGIVTAAAVTNITGERPFVLSRSTFSGSGAHVAHWTGDNAAAWQDLRVSITTSLLFNALGAPFVGADICGFMGATWPELCARWIALGSFYTFSRNHNDISSPPQELYRWPEVASAARKSLIIRYQLLPHLHSLFARVHACGGSIMRPIWWTTNTHMQRTQTTSENWRVAPGAWKCMENASTDLSRSESRVDEISDGTSAEQSVHDVQEHSVLDRTKTPSLEPSLHLEQHLLAQNVEHETLGNLRNPNLYSSSTTRAPGGHKATFEAHLDGGTEYEESAQDDQWLWGSDVMITPIVMPGVTARNVTLPEGSHWLCWKGCPEGVAATQRSDCSDQHSINADVPLFIAWTVLDAGVPGGKQDAAGTQRQSQHPSIASGGTVVHVSGVEIDLVPVWLRFGAILPISSLNTVQKTSVFSTHADKRQMNNSSVVHRSDAAVGEQQGQAAAGQSASGSSWKSDHDRHMEMDENGFDFHIPTAEESLQAPVTLFVLLGDHQEKQENGQTASAAGFFYQDDGKSQQVNGLRSELAATTLNHRQGVIENIVVSRGERHLDGGYTVSAVGGVALFAHTDLGRPCGNIRDFSWDLFGRSSTSHTDFKAACRCSASSCGEIVEHGGIYVDLSSCDVRMDASWRLQWSCLS